MIISKTFFVFVWSIFSGKLRCYMSTILKKLEWKFSDCCQKFLDVSFSCLPLFLSVCLSICLSVCLFVYLSVFLSVFLSVCLSVCLSVYVSVCLSVCLSACLSVCFSVRPSVHLSRKDRWKGKGVNWQRKTQNEK